MDILILGGSGQLGQTVYKELKNNFKVVSFNKSQLSILDKQGLIKAINKYCPKFIVNCSAYTKVELAEIEKEKANDVNYIGIKNLCEAAKLNQVSLIHFSTDYVFDGLKNSPYSEDDRAIPLNEYGVSKLKGENYLIDNFTNFFIFRVSGIYSEYGENFVKTMMKLRDKERFSVINDQVMKPSSASFIADFIKINLLKKNFIPSNTGLYNLASNGPKISWYGFAELIFQEMLKQKLIAGAPEIFPILSKDYASSVMRPKFSVLSNNKVKKKFILPNGDYREILKKELFRIYKSL